MAQLKRWDVDHLSEDEALLIDRPLEEVGRVIAARYSVDAEETDAVESTRPTLPVFLGEPWL